MLASTALCRARPLIAQHSSLASSYYSSASYHSVSLTAARHSTSLLSLTTMHTSQHPYRIHTTTPTTQSPITLSSSQPHTPHQHPTTTLPSSSSSTTFYHPTPSHLTTHAQPDPTALSFSVMQYNILAGPLATSEHFPFAKPHLLDWSYRRQAIIDKIKEMMTPSPTAASASSSSASASASSAGLGSLPTFLCFQELTDYWTYFEPQLSALGYKSIYIKRPSLHMSNWSGTEKHDGCLIAYQHTLIARVVDVEQINYDDSHDRVGLVALLQWAAPPQGVCPYVLVGTTHLYWDHRLLAVQVNELDQLLTSVTRMQRKHETDVVPGVGGEEGGEGVVVGPIPTVISGDFNNGPNSQIYSRVVDHHTFHPTATTPTTASSSNNSRGNSRSANGSSRTTTQHSAAQHDKHFLYRYESSYAAGGKEPPCTTATHRRCWTIDYIFYSHSATPLPTTHTQASTTPHPPPTPLLRVTHTNPLPSEADLRSESGPVGWNDDERLKRAGQIQEGIPNSKQPSDHVPLFARFEVVGRQQQGVERRDGLGEEEREEGGEGEIGNGGGSGGGSEGGRKAALLEKR